jgi:hypothetical protein
MLEPVIFNWTLFCIAFGGMLVCSLVMGWQSLRFYTWDVVVRRFSIMDLEFPATAKELVTLIKGLYRLPKKEQSQQSVRALKGQLYVDFLFMPFAYGTVFLLCMQVANKMELPAGRGVYVVLAWLQGVSWLCDIIENAYLLQKIKPEPVESTTAVHKAYVRLEMIKWGIVLTGVISSIACICYFWLSGAYAAASLHYLLIVIGEIVVFVFASRLFLRNK